VILGDLFEYWIGPAQAREPNARRVLDGLRALAGNRCAIEVVHGNRDFLLDEGFERASGTRLRPGGFVGLLPGARDRSRRVLVVHGDELCTLDRPYQRLRRVLRSGPVRWLVPRLPGPLAQGLARRLRRASRRAVAAKPDPQKAQQPETCRELARRHDCAALVCGHVHRFRDETLPDGPRWLVVDAFGGELDGVAVDARGELAPCAATPPGFGAAYGYAAAGALGGAAVGGGT